MAGEINSGPSVGAVAVDDPGEAPSVPGCCRSRQRRRARPTTLAAPAATPAAQPATSWVDPTAARSASTSSPSL